MSTEIQFFYRGKEISLENLDKLTEIVNLKPEDEDHISSLSNDDDEDQYQRYASTLKTVKSVLEKYGVAIIPNVLSEKEIENMKSGMWDYLEHVTSKFEVPIDRNNKKTWRSFYDLLPLHSMLVQHWQIGHAQYVWDLRQNPKIIDIFCKIWSVKKDELLVSFDGASVSMPHEVTNRGYYRGNEWLHVDQNFASGSKFECIQSWVTAFDVKQGDATLRVLEGSHLHHKEFAEHKKKSSSDEWWKKNSKSDWYKFEQEELEFFKERGCKPRNILCPPGSMVFWDSRLVHSGKEAVKTRKESNFRCVVYLCYTPKSFADSKVIEKRKKAFNDKRTTSHWPHKAKMFPKIPRLYGNSKPNVVDVPDPKLTEIGKSLI